MRYLELAGALSAWFVCFIAPASFAAGDAVFGPTLRDQVGVCIHFTDAKSGEMDMLADAGFGLIRTDLLWQDTERKPGVYDFARYDHLLSDLDRHHIRALWILDYGNPLYDGGSPPDTPAARDAFARWAAAAVDHFRGHRILWEMWNEPHPDWTDGYIKLALETGQAIQRVAPSETFIGPADAGIDMSFLKTCFQDGTLSYWRAVTVHPYRTSMPETAADDFNKSKALISRYESADENVPLLAGEWGYTVMPADNSSSLDASEQRQAQYFDREVLTDLSAGVPLTIWYDWHNDSDNPADTEGNYGLVRYPFHAGRSPVYDPKPSYYAAKTLLRTFGAFRFSRVIAVPEYSDALVFEFVRKHERGYVAYCDGPSSESVPLPIPPGKYRILDMVGGAQPDQPLAGSAPTLTLTGSPQFILPR